MFCCGISHEARRSRDSGTGARVGTAGLRGGGVCPARAQRTTFVLTIPALTLEFPSPRGAPQVDQSAPQTFPTKHAA